MDGLGQYVFEDGLRQGREDGICAMIMDKLDRDIPKGRIIEKLKEAFGLTEEKAVLYYETFADEV